MHPLLSPSAAFHLSTRPLWRQAVESLVETAGEGRRKTDRSKGREGGRSVEAGREHAQGLQVDGIHAAREAPLSPPQQQRSAEGGGESPAYAGSPSLPPSLPSSLLLSPSLEAAAGPG
eukprot:664950-Rhodomonas_salina.1